MRDNYTIYMGDLIKNSDSFAELKAIAENGSDPYEIYLIRQSSMNNKNFYRKILVEADIEKAIILIGRGRTQKDVAKQMHIGPDTLRRVIRDYNLENTNI